MARDWTKRWSIVCGLVALGFCQFLHSSGTAIIGGTQATSDIYAAFVSPSAVATPLTGSLPTTGSIASVAINAAGNAIIGGEDNDNMLLFAALVSSEGIATPLSYTGGVTPTGPGLIYSVAINSTGNGIIGGTTNNTNDVYVALVSSSGVASALSGETPAGEGLIRSVAINDGGAAIIGGTNLTTATYAALVSPSGVAKEISGAGAPLGIGLVQSVAINSSGSAIVGGQDNGVAYAALVSPSGVATSIQSVPSAVSIQAVALNEGGLGLIGGQNLSSLLPYAALVTPEGVAEILSPDSPPIGSGAVNSVAINNAGQGIIGGAIYGNTPYIVLVSPSQGTQTVHITGDIPVGVGNIQSVAINDAGISIVGGADHLSETPYVALISPLGVATTITGTLPVGNGQILGVALQNILSELVPSSFGPGSSFANSLFALSSQILPNHTLHYHPLLQKSNPFESSKEVGLLAHASDRVLAKVPDPNRTSFYSIWGSIFGEYTHQEKTDRFVSYNNSIAGALLCFEGHISSQIFGGGLAYAYNYVALSESEGHAKIQQEFATFYASFSWQNFYIDAAIWGGLYQMHNVRHSLGVFTSTAYAHGWLFSPHFEIGGYFFGEKPWFSIEPFGMVDWANNWQSQIEERGASGFNLLIDSQYTSLLRSEVGVRFFESLSYGWGKLILMEKASFVNKTPFNAGTISASFIGSLSSFGLETFSSEIDNLGAIQFNMEFIPSNPEYIYGSLNYQGEFGPSFQSNLLSFEIGKDF